MGDLIYMNFNRRHSRIPSEQSALLSADFVEGKSNRTQNAVLSNVGFEDAIYWRIPQPYRHGYSYRGLVASPEIIATKAPDQVRVVKMMEGPTPGRLDDHTSIMVNLDAWVLTYKLHYGNERLEMWIVFDDGARFELRPTLTLAQTHAEFAMRQMRIEGIHKLSTSEAAAIVLGDTY